MDLGVLRQATAKAVAYSEQVDINFTPETVDKRNRYQVTDHWGFRARPTTEKDVRSELFPPGNVSGCLTPY